MAITHVQHSIERVEQVLVVGHHDESSIIAGNLVKKQAQDPLFVFRIEISCWFVSEEQRR